MDCEKKIFPTKTILTERSSLKKVLIDFLSILKKLMIKDRFCLKLEYRIRKLMYKGEFKKVKMK